MGYEIREAQLPASEAVAIRTTVPLAGIPNFLGEAFHELDDAIRAGGGQVVGPPFVRYHSVSPDAVDLEAVLCTEERVPARGRVVPITLRASKAAVVRHVGHYSKLQPAYEAIDLWVKEHGLHATEAPREVYVTSPAEIPDPSEWVTLVEQPVG